MFKWFLILFSFAGCYPAGPGTQMSRDRETINVSVCVADTVQFNEVMHLFAKQKEHVLDFQMDPSCDFSMVNQEKVELLLVAESRSIELDAQVKPKKKYSYLGVSDRLLPFKVEAVTLNRKRRRVSEVEQIVCSESFKDYRFGQSNCSSFVVVDGSLSNLFETIQGQTLMLLNNEHPLEKSDAWSFEKKYWFESMQWYAKIPSSYNPEEKELLKKLKASVEIESGRLIGRRMKLSAR